MFVRSPTLPVAFLPQYDRKVAIWHKWQSFGREECAEESLEMGLRRQIKHGFRRREAVSRRDGCVIGRFFSDFASERWELSCRCGGERGKWRARGVRSGRVATKSPQVFRERRGVFAKSCGVSSRTCAVFLRRSRRLGQNGRRYKKLPALRRMGECAQVVDLRFLSGGYALASGAPKGVAVRPTPSVAAG